MVITGQETDPQHLALNNCKMEDRDCFVSLIIPAYNEEERIAPTLERTLRYLSGQDYTFEVIVVDDGSTDNTTGVVREVAGKDASVTVLLNGENRGKGYTVKSGMLSAKGEYLFFTDADLSTPIEELERCLPYLLNGYDVVIGSRSLPDADIVIRQPWYREKMGKIFNLMVRIILLKGIIDTQCGFKGFRREAARTIFSKCVVDGFSFDVEALYLAQKQRHRIKEEPIQWKNSALSKVSPIKHSLQMFTSLVGIRLNDIKGRYD